MTVPNNDDFSSFPIETQNHAEWDATECRPHGSVPEGEFRESVAHNHSHSINNMTMVEIDLLDGEDAIQRDETGVHLYELVTSVLNDCATADRYFATSKSKRFSCCCCSKDTETHHGEKCLTNQLRTHVNCCIRVADKYLRLLSVLIKSREFHLAYPTAHESDEDLPVIIIPKSREGKPFIPTPTGQRSDYEFSVSHQYPYVGIARCRGVEVGLDIVTFDEINCKLYSDEQEFVSVFRSSFSESEWDSIASSTTVLNDFYMRWAMKEAYTKALGLGMSLEFNSFVTTLAGVDNLWDYVSVNADPVKGIVLPGFVQHGGEQSPERWLFFFLLIKSKGRVTACACVCIPDDDGANSLTVESKWMKIDELLTWHRYAKGGLKIQH